MQLVWLVQVVPGAGPGAIVLASRDPLHGEGMRVGVLK